MPELRRYVDVGRDVAVRACRGRHAVRPTHEFIALIGNGCDRRSAFTVEHRLRRFPGYIAARARRVSQSQFNMPELRRYVDVGRDVAVRACRGRHAVRPTHKFIALFGDGCDRRTAFAVEHRLRRFSGYAAAGTCRVSQSQFNMPELRRYVDVGRDVAVRACRGRHAVRPTHKFIALFGDGCDRRTAFAVEHRLRRFSGYAAAGTCRVSQSQFNTPELRRCVDVGRDIAVRARIVRPAVRPTHKFVALIRNSCDRRTVFALFDRLFRSSVDAAAGSRGIHQAILYDFFTGLISRIFTARLFGSLRAGLSAVRSLLSRPAALVARGEGACGKNETAHQCDKKK